MVLIALLLILASAVYGKEYIPAMTGLIDDKVKRIAQAIATAEGFYAAGSNIPKDRNNPGNLMWREDGVITTFATEQEGWNALYTQISKMLAGRGTYNPSMTIAEVSQLYVGDSDCVNWAANVAKVLGVSTSTRLGDVA